MHAHTYIAALVWQSVFGEALDFCRDGHIIFLCEYNIYGLRSSEREVFLR